MCSSLEACWQDSQELLSRLVQCCAGSVWFMHTKHRSPRLKGEIYVEMKVEVVVEVFAILGMYSTATSGGEEEVSIDDKKEERNEHLSV